MLCIVNRSDEAAARWTGTSPVSERERHAKAAWGRHESADIRETIWAQHESRVTTAEVQAFGSTKCDTVRGHVFNRAGHSCNLYVRKSDASHYNLRRCSSEYLPDAPPTKTLW